MKAEMKEVEVPKPPRQVILTMDENEAQALIDSFGNYGNSMADNFNHRFNPELTAYVRGQAKKIYFPLYTALRNAGLGPKYRSDEKPRAAV